MPYVRMSSSHPELISDAAIFLRIGLSGMRGRKYNLVQLSSTNPGMHVDLISLATKFFDP